MGNMFRCGWKASEIAPASETKPRLNFKEHPCFHFLTSHFPWACTIHISVAFSSMTKLKRMSFMSCCIVQEQKHAEPHSAMKHSFTQTPYKTALSRNKWGHSSFPLMKRKRIYDRLWNDEMYFSLSLKWSLPTSVPGVKLCKDPLHCLASITHHLLLNDPQGEAQPNQKYPKSCLHWFGDIRYHYQI